MEESHKDKVHEMALDPAYANIPLNQLVILALGDDILTIASQLSTKAKEKIDESKIPSSGGGQ